jgi:hypothetical protein
LITSLFGAAFLPQKGRNFRRPSVKDRCRFGIASEIGDPCRRLVVEVWEYVWWPWKEVCGLEGELPTHDARNSPHTVSLSLYSVPLYV